MSSRFKQFRIRLARLEATLGKRSQPRETSLYHRVLLEAQQELSPEELALLKSAQAAQSERRFHSLEEHDVQEKYQRFVEVVAQRYGTSDCALLYQHMESLQESLPKSERSAPAGLVEILHWGRDNSRHLQMLREEASQASSSTSGTAFDASSGSQI
jgi:hypothetical protein